MRVFSSIDELAQNVGQELGVSQWRTITQDDIDVFAKVTNDEQWIHVDAQRAADGPFGTTVAHGYLTLSLIPGLVRTVYQLDGLAMAVNYGSNKVRYPAPVPTGATVRARVKLLSVERTEPWSQSIIQVTIEQQANGMQSKPGCVAEIVSRLYESPGTSSGT